MSTLVQAVCLLIVSAGGLASQNATKNQVGDHCTTRGKDGEWKNIFDCPSAQASLQLSDRLTSLVQTHDLLVCCEITNTGAKCMPGFNYFQFTRVDCDTNRTQPQVIVTEYCSRYSQEEGESCLIDGTVGLWTYDERFCASRSGDTLRGCCRLASKSAKMCIEYGRQMTVDGCGKPEDHPFMVELFDSRRVSLSYCDGTLISDHFVLTDAWCLKTHAVSYVRIGTATLTPLFRVSEAIVHPEYDGIVKNDVGLLRILDKITFTPEIHPVCLPQLRVIEDEAHTMVAYESTKSLPTWLINVTRIGDADFCMMQHLCMKRSTSHPCNIKLGSPLLVDRKDTSCLRTLAGIKVWSTGCEKLFFMRILPVLDWIEEIVWK